MLGCHLVGVTLPGLRPGANRITQRELGVAQR